MEDDNILNSISDKIKNDVIEPLSGKIVYPLTKKEWGNAHWNYLHSITANYPNIPKHQDKINMQSSLYHFVYNIPCLEPCRESAVNYVKHNPPKLGSKNSLFNWSVDFHNFVNDKLGKPKKSVELRNDPAIEEQLAVKRRSLSMDQMYSQQNQVAAQPQQSEIDQRFNTTFSKYGPALQEGSVDQLAQNIQQQDMMMNVQPEINRDNVLSGFEPTFEFLGGALGIKATDLNLIVTPNLLVGIMQNVAAANMTLLGQFTVSTLASLIFIAAGAIVKDGVGYGDRLLMQTLGFSYLSDAIIKLNNKERDRIFEEGTKTMDTIGNWGKEGRDPIKELIDCFIETPAMKTDKEKPQLQGLEATLLDGVEGADLFGGSVADIRQAQNDSQGFFDSSSSQPSGIGRRTSSDPLNISRTINRERNTLPSFIDNVRQISVDQSALNDIPVPTYILPK